MQIKAPFMFDCEQGVALKAMHGTQASSLGEGKVSYICSSCDCNLGYISSYGGDGHSELVFVPQRPDSCLVMRETPGSSKRLGRA